MEPGRLTQGSFARHIAPRAAEALVFALPGAAGVALGAAGWRWRWFDTTPAGLLLLALETALAAVALLSLWLALRERVTRRRRAIEQIGRELRYLAPWAGPEGVLRKTGLIRDLNALGAAPRDLRGAALEGADLSACDLRGADLRGADLRGADLQAARLDGADLSGAHLAEADLSRASLTGLNARGASFAGAALVKAELAGADLCRADLVNANLHGAGLNGVSLERARFAAPDASPFGSAIHPSVDDWIRERLDARGYYRSDARGDGVPAPARKAEAG
jgi:hypothetical protein